jgi:hypothetical protein
MEMKMKRAFWSAIIILSLLASAGANAAPNMIIGNDTINTGGVASISLLFQADGTTTDLSFDLDYDETQFAATQQCVASVPTTGANASVVCSIVDIGGGDLVVRVAVLPVVTFPIPPILTPEQSLGTISFDNTGGAAGAFPIAIVAGTEKYFNGGAPVTGTGSTDGQIIVQAVSAAYSSNPTPAQGVDLGSVEKDDINDPMVNVDISNSGAAGTTLTGTCSESSDPDNVFSLSGDTAFSVLQGDPADTVVVTCDSGGDIGPHSGEMTCTHNGDNMGDAIYALSCTIEPPPAPMYSSNPAAGSPIALGPTEQNNLDPTANIAITNTGAVGTVLDGTCEIVLGGDPQITLITDGSFSVAEDAAVDVETVSCDATAAPDTYNATLSCSYVASNVSPATYAVSCEITPPGQAMFRSTPVLVAVNMTPGDNPPVNDPPPTSLRTFFNGANPGSSDLNIACSISGDAAISVLPDISGGIAIDPDTDSSVIFSCDTAAADSFSATYSCDYTVDGTSLPSDSAMQATYTYTCDVREAEADVVPAPPPGTITESVQPGGTAVYTVEFGLKADEGVDGRLTSCSLADGTNFTITSPVVFPVTIPAGGPSVTVTVEGTDPGDGSNPTDTLTCTYTDTANPNGTDAVYPLVLVVGVFESVPIPTLSQYGLAILALLMLGFGMVGFRRFS